MAGVSAEQMAAAMAIYPMLKPAIAKMSAEGSKIDGTAVQTTTTLDAVKSMTLTGEVLKVVTDVAPADVAVSAGFKEGR